MNLVEVVLLRDDVQNLGRVLAVVGGVPLANVLDPAKSHQRCNHANSTTATTPPQPLGRSLEYSDHPVGAVMNVLKVPVTTSHAHAKSNTAQKISRIKSRIFRHFQQKSLKCNSEQAHFSMTGLWFLWIL